MSNSDERRREHFQNVFVRIMQPNPLTTFLLFFREHHFDVENSKDGWTPANPPEKRGNYARDDMNLFYSRWIEETERMVEAQKKGEPYTIDYEAIWGKPYNQRNRT